MRQAATRRQFLQQSASLMTAAAAGAGFFPVPLLGRVKASDIRLGLIGCGSIMSHHIKGLVARRTPVQIAWLCDVDPAQIDRATLLLDGFQPQAPRRTGRFEDVLEDRNVDAVIIATPHHWHAPIAIAAMQAGKDVYIEKPISHVYREGHAIIETARKQGRIVQQGSQMRSSPVTDRAGELLSQGIIGEIKMARAWTAEPRQFVAPLADSDVPAGVDYDRWLGPAPVRPFNAHRFHQTWRMFRDYANGEIGDDGIHDIDMAVWGLGVTDLPRQITARGGRMLPPGSAGDYPDNMHVTFEFPDGKLLVYENLPFTPYGIHGFDNGNVFYGTEGYMIFSRRGAFSVFLGPKSTPGPTEGKGLRGLTGYAQHMDNFLESMRTRKPTRAPAETAHRSCALVHLAEIVYRTAGRLDFDPVKEEFVGHAAANEMLGKTYRAPYTLPSLG